MTSWTLTAATVPRTLGDPAGWALRGVELVSRACDHAAWGHDDTAYRAASLATILADQTYTRRIYLVATEAERVGDPEAAVGFGHVAMPREGNDHLAEVEVWVRPDQRGRGLGTVLLDAVEQIAREAGRRTLLAASEHVGEADAQDPSALTPPTGAGRVRAADPQARFLQRHGYRLEQGERYSMLNLPLPDGTLGRLHADAARHAGDAYRLVRWTDHAPQELIEGVAVLLTRMSTDAPLGALDIREEAWTVERYRAYERRVVESGRHSIGVGAVHAGIGELAALTLVETIADTPEALDQGDTIVLPEHRGHRLGLLVKTEMVRVLADQAPQARRVHTWNAEENAHMLGINVALGFRPLGVIGVWQKVLD